MSQSDRPADTKKRHEEKLRVKLQENEDLFKRKQIHAIKPSQSLQAPKKTTAKFKSPHYSLPNMHMEKKVITISKNSNYSETSGLPSIQSSEENEENYSHNVLFNEKESTENEHQNEDEKDFQYEYVSYYGDGEDEFSPMKQAKNYLEQRKIEDFFKFLGAHLTAAQPDNPIDFLLDLLQQCIEYRTTFCEPPLLFELKHIESLYKSLDRMGTGEISPDQYDNGLLMLGVKQKTGDFTPTINENLMISKQVFITDAYKLLTRQLNQMICIPVDGKKLSSLKIPASNSKTSLTRSG